MSVQRLKYNFFGISHYICPASIGLIDFLNAAADFGFVGVGLTQGALEEMPVKTLKRELGTRGLTVTSVNSAGYFLNNEPEAAARQAERNRWLIDCAAELQSAWLNVIVGGMGQARGCLTLEQSRQRATEALGVFHQEISIAGVKMIVEPLHPIALWLKGCLNSLAQVENAIRGMPMASINLDLYHSWWDPDLIPFINRPESPLGMFQICDVGDFAIDGTPRRIPLGEGVIDLSPLLDGCLRRNSRPTIEVELFAIQLPGRPLFELLDKTVKYLNSLSMIGEGV